MRAFLYDTTVFVYALGAAHDYREPCREILRRQGQGDLASGVTPVVLAEVVHQRLRQTGDRAGSGRPGGAGLGGVRVHATDPADAQLA